MRSNSEIIVAVLILFYSALSIRSKAEAIIYPTAESSYFATDFEVTVDGEPVAVYDMLRQVYHNWADISSFPFATFGLNGNPVTVRIKVPVKVNKVTVRPLQLGIECHLEDERTFSFNLDKPCKISIEFNDDVSRPLMIFANPKEDFTEQLNGKELLHFKAGKVYNVGIIQMESNQVVFIEAGAIVKGAIAAKGKENISVVGYGILLNEFTQPSKKGPSIFRINDCRNVTINGPVMVNRYDSWSVNLIKSKNIQINNLKILAETRDGLDVNSCTDMVFDNSYVLAGDDCIAIKAAMWGSDEGGKGESVKNIQILNSIVFNTAGGNALEVGYESCTDTMSQILFKNIDIIHALPNSDPQFPESAMSIHLSDFALVKDVGFEDILVEDNQDDWLIHMNIWKSYATKIDRRGNIRDVHFKNIRVVDGPVKPVGLYGHDDNHTVENVILQNIWIKGKNIESLGELQYKQNEFVKNITLKK